MKSNLNASRTKRTAVFSLMLLVSAMAFAQTQPVVNGAVFGGGRMADVEGSTLVTVVNCDTLGAVYGGNDIAGKVLCNTANANSHQAAEVVVGTAASSSTIAIGSVYGGGNGYYYYPGVGTDVTTDALAAGTIRNYGNTADEVEVEAGLLVPQAVRTMITVATEYPQIDSVFGGAKNAFITAASDNSTDITLNGGTIYACFGGNNYGGTLAEGSTQHTLITSTTTAANSVHLGGDEGSAWTSDGSGHGVRYLFGGGNAVEAQQVNIVVNGGQIDTLFAGGNAADVASATVTVNVTSPLYTYTKSPYYDATTDDPYSPTTSIYDVRCLFGGNNAADMTRGVPSLIFTKGGIHFVYGGGNRGNMTYGDSYNDGTEDRQRSTLVLVSSADMLIDSIYGGGQSAGTSYDTYVKVTNGRVGNIYGGTNIQGDIPATAKTYVEVSGTGHVYGNVFGGSNGCYLCLNYNNYLEGNTNRTVPDDRYDWLANYATPKIWNSDVRLAETGQVDGFIYGGGNLASMGHVNAAYTNPTTEVGGNTMVTISGGTVGRVATSGDTIAGGVYGGGNYASIYGYTNLVISGGTIYGDVYGGNDKTGTVSGVRDGSTAPIITTTTTRPSETYDANMPLYASVGSTLTRSQTQGASYVRITGTPQIFGSVFGGGNGNYNYYHYDTDGVTEVPDMPAGMTWDNSRTAVLKCGNPPFPNQGSALVDLNVSDGTWIKRVFAGGNYATVGTEVSLGTGQQLSNAGKATIWFNSESSATSEQQVGTLFGGNNMVAMNVVPELYLLQGRAAYVYGGGNQGSMTAASDLGSLAFELSTYVGLASSTFQVDSNVYGGCNAADVSQQSYVYATRGKVMQHIFGGCDAAGQILTKTNVLIDGDDTYGLTIGGNVYGGGNGNYPFYEYSYINPSTGVPNVHYNDAHTNPYYVANSRNGAILYPDVVGRPYCNETDVQIKGTLTLDGNVYGGGVSGDCLNTSVLIDAPEGVFNGVIFGAGQGRVDNMGLRINGTCKSYYIGVAQFDNNGDLTFGQGNAMGNVLGTATLTINDFKSMSGSRKAIFGGGQSGNVNNVEILYNNTAESPIDALYLGCLASDVTGRTHAVVNGYTPANGTTIIDTIYGGNDFTGRVEETYLEINSGIFNHVFGAGNGDYGYKDSLAVWTAAGGRLNDDAGKFSLGEICADTVPYSMKVTVDFNGGVYLGTVYGGGNMGLVGDRDMDPSDMLASEDARDEHIGSITLNVHDGEFHRHIFTGARGKADMKGIYFGAAGFTAAGTAGKNVDGGDLGKQLAYAYKQLNMDGGTVKFSVYGGSEAVDDGFPYECIGKQYSSSSWYNNTSSGDNHSNYDVNTTKRPSSVLNIVAGDVRKSVYGGGYQGNIYGSVFVNIGVDAVNDSPVWSTTYCGVDNFLASCKPNLIGASGATTTISGNPTLRAGEGGKNLTLEASVYNASDWGEAGDIAFFNTRGVYGGVTNILVDGKGYNTSQTNPNLMTLPNMDIANSIIGAGTSTEGGDINRLITVRHYGDFVCPNPSKSLASIQRADKVILDSVFIDMQGEQDAYMAYVSPSYSFCRIDTLLFRIDNMIIIEAPANYVGHIASMKDDEVTELSATHLYQNEGTLSASNNQKAEKLLDNLDWNISSDNCSDNSCQGLGFCDKIPERGAAGKPGAFNTLAMRNGSYVKVYPFVDLDGDGLDDGHAYGVVDGWMYLLAQDNTMSYVYAENKTGSINPNDGGFISLCPCDNLLGAFTTELDYINVDIYGYRSWEIGYLQGSRSRHITLVANATPDNVLNHNLAAGNYGVNDSDGNTYSSSDPEAFTVDAGDHYAYATATLELPPAKGGNFYLINSVLIDQDNGGQLQLTDQAYDQTTNTIYQRAGSAMMADMTSIAGAGDYDQNYTFGLTFSSSDAQSNFASGCWLGTTPDGASSPLTNVSAPQVYFERQLCQINGAETTYYRCWPISGVSGSSYLQDAGGYISPAIAEGNGVIPTLNFTLTYDTRLTTTITREVIFTIYEFDKYGNYVGPVDVTITISTVIKDFDDLSASVLAMYNEGISNEYVRKVTIPASFLQRDIFLEGISWEPDADVKNTPSKNDWFHMKDTVTPIEHNNQFSIVVSPSESMSENVTNHLGWYNIENTNLDVYEIALNDYNNTTGTSTFTNAQTMEYNSYDYDGDGTGTDTTKLKTEDDGAILLGTLDGRASAGIDVKLKFDGMRVYHDQYEPSPLGWVTLHLRWQNTKTDGSGTFDLKIQVRTREEGDTIYMAPLATLERVTDEGETLTVHSYKHYFPSSTPYDKRVDIRNNPDCYVNTLREAMSIYQEGDVIDIMETIPVTDGSVPITVSGDDYSIIQIIRYSGSHYKFPSHSCAHLGPMINVGGNGILNMRNVWLNGSGCTMVKPSTSVAPSDPAANTYGYHTQSGSVYYYENYARVKDILYAQAPILLINGNGSVNFSSNVRMSNNFNEAKQGQTGAVMGGAVAIVAENASDEPSLVLGNNCNFYDNMIRDWHAATTTDPIPATPLNWGAGVYVDGGTLTLGTGASHASEDGTVLHIARNYYLKSSSSDHLGIEEKTKIMLDETEFTFHVYEIDTLSHPSAFSLSNVHLGRTAGTCPGPVRRDIKSDVVYFISDMSTKSRVGINKWFPGYMYDGDATHVYTQSDDANAAGYHRFYNTVPRDTVMIARLGEGKSNASMADRVYNSGIFFNDSSYFSNTDGVAPAFYQSNVEGKVTYDGDQTENPGYDDRVYLFHHSYVNQFAVYLQRCASFGKGVSQTLTTCNETVNGSTVSLRFNDYQQGDSIAYRWNKDASCVASTDTILFRVGGGFFPYTYHWDYDSVYAAATFDDNRVRQTKTMLKRIPIRDRVTTGTNNISGLDNAHFDALRAAAQCDTLVLTDLRQNQDSRKSTYFYLATAYDLTGNCPVYQPVIVRVGKVTADETTYGHSAEYLLDSLNYLRHRNPYAANPDSADKYYTDFEASNGDYVNDADHAQGTGYYQENGSSPSVKLYNKFESHAEGYTDRYLYYRIKAPGVDSSSFHDHVPTDASGNLIDRETGRSLTIAKIASGEGDTLKYYYLDDENVEHQGHPIHYVPRHMHGTASDDPTSHLGVRRAGYSHVPFHHFGKGYNMGTLEQRKYADTYKGKPYHDTRSAYRNGTDEVIYVNADGTTNAELTAAYSELYADEMLPRYLRVFRAFKIDPTIQPVAARGEVKIYAGSDATEELDRTTTEFCPGDIVHLRPTPVSTDWEYMGWSFDATSQKNAVFVVKDDPTENAPVAYYSPGDYWFQVVKYFENHTGNATSHPVDSTATLDDYDLDYYGNVTIKTNKGLAWLISTVNGYNGQNAHTFHFNTITFNFDGSEVDMSAHKWTPLGNLNNHFEGTVVGDGSGTQVVKGLIVNENTIPRVGMFGYLDSADLSNFNVQGSLMKGNSYVGGLAAESKNSHVSNYESDDDVLFGAYVIGGVIAKSDKTTLKDVGVNNMTMMGNAIDAGSFVARTNADTVTNSYATVNYEQLSAVNIGGATGVSDTSNNNPTGGKLAQRTVLHNNYVRIQTAENSNNVGGLMGNASSVEMQNCYAHGVAKGRDYVGGIAGLVGNDVSVTNCYYSSDMADGKTGYVEYGTPVQKSSSFSGKGKQVLLTQKVDGYNNLLRALNAWVNSHDPERYNHWHSDETGDNDGHPVFGDQEMITVYDTVRAEVCDSYEMDGIDFTESGRYIFHVVDSADYLDSTMTLLLTLHYSDSVALSDTVDWGTDYNGQGFHLTSQQILDGIGSQGQQEVYTFRYVDSLQTAYGCDSLVVLTLYVVGNGQGVNEVPQQLADVKVYPNPTRGMVTVEGSDLQHVEVYDNVSRRVYERSLEGDRMQFDLSNQAAGAYYVRVKTAHGTVVKKVIKK